MIRQFRIRSVHPSTPILTALLLSTLALAAPTHTAAAKGADGTPADFSVVDAVPVPEAAPAGVAPAGASFAGGITVDPSTTVDFTVANRAVRLFPPAELSAAPDMAALGDLTLGSSSVTGEPGAADMTPYRDDAVTDQAGPDAMAPDAISPLDFGGMQRVNNPTASPWRMNVRLFMRFPGSSSQYACSGAMIGSRHVLTAGHCVYSAPLGGWYTSIIVVPGYSNGSEPFGRGYATSARSWAGWTSNGDTNFDMAVVRVDRSLGNSTGWYGYGFRDLISGGTRYADCGYYRGNLFNGVGYPVVGVDNGSSQWTFSGNFDACQGTGLLRFNRGYYAGMDGGATYLYNGSSRIIHGVLSARSGAGYATRFDQNRFQSVQQFINAG